MGIIALSAKVAREGGDQQDAAIQRADE